MPKQFRLIKPGDSVERASIDWTMCILCQKKTSESLVQPWKGRGRGNGGTEGTSYHSFAINIGKYNELGKLPLNLCLDQFDDGSGIEGTLQTNRASWHKTCRNQFSSYKLQRSSKRPHEPDITTGEVSTPVKTRRSSIESCDVHTKNKHLCFFCGEVAGSAGLHEVSTMGIDESVRLCATKLKDRDLLAKLAPGDMVALEAKYHKNCLNKLYNRYRSSKRNENENQSVNESFQSIALAELISYIEELSLTGTKTVPVLRLADLVSMYSERLNRMTVDNNHNYVHPTRLKERILLHCPYLKAVTQGRDTLLTYDAAVGDAIFDACSDYDSEALQLAKAAKIVRRQILNQGHSFKGSLCEDQLETPSTLIALVNMILDGPSIESQIHKAESSTQATRSISQLITFNSIRSTNKPRPSVTRHNREREVPIPVYLGLKVHVKTRKRDLIDCLFRHGLSISYDRVMTISSSVANSIIDRFEEDGVVCPPQLKGGLFTTGQVDNIDHNPSATTSTSSFHGTAHSLCQHPRQDSLGINRGKIDLEQNTSNKTIRPLPLAYTNIMPVEIMPKEFKAPIIHGPMKPQTNKLVDDRRKENKWLEKQMSLTEGTTDMEEYVSWAAYHASLHPNTEKLPTVTALMPMFREASHSFAMIMHTMKTNQAATQFLNPGQIPVLTMDQPLYAIGKQIQWRFPELFGEDKYVVMLGPLHTEMAFLKVIGDLLDGSGWSNAIAQSNIANDGTAESFIDAAHMAKTRRAHQITAASLHVLRKRAYSAKCTKHDAAPSDDITFDESFTEWCKTMRLAHPMFLFWSLVLDLELIILAFVRSLRTSDFELYIECLAKLAPWFFALDHVHYARWLPVHIRDMSTLIQRCPNVYENFMLGNFTSNKTGNAFSAIGLDQCHEQMNAYVKGDGGAIGLTEDPSALRRWMVAGPQLSAILVEYEDQVNMRRCKTDKHHEQSPSTQQSFTKDVCELVSTIEEMGNPFLDESTDLLTLDSQDIMPKNVVDTIQKIQTLGEKQYMSYIEERFVKSEKPISAKIPRNSLALFSKPRKAISSKEKLKLNELKSDCALFARLYVSSQSREGNLEEFFKHENQQYPPSISTAGKLRTGKKSDLIDCLESKLSSTNFNAAPAVEMKVFDGAAVVHLLSVGESKTFNEYAQQIFRPYISMQLEQIQRIDLVWDVYIKNSLKFSTRENRGTGIRKRVSPHVRLPGNWKNFLRNDDNKDELFQFLAHESISHVTESKVVISTLGEGVVCSKLEQNIERLQPCSHEEADTRIFVHVFDGMKCGLTRMMIRTVDTDIVVLAVSKMRNLIDLKELWIAFGTGKKFRYIPIHELSRSLGPQMANGLPFFHAFTGSDTTSYFANYGKKSAWQTWLAYPVISETFAILSSPSASVNPHHVIRNLERFVVLMYNRTSDLEHVDTARMMLFSKMSRNIDNIPPTKAALEQHIKRAVYQAGHVWGQALELRPLLPKPTDWGWETDGNRFKPRWTTLPVAEKACQELISCKCSKSCKGNCKCFKANLECTKLCKCDGNCYEV